MTGKVRRRNLLRRTVEIALAGAMTIKVSSGASETEDEKLQVEVPDRIVAGKPFKLQINVAKVGFGKDNIVMLLCKYPESLFPCINTLYKEAMP